MSIKPILVDVHQFANVASLAQLRDRILADPDLALRCRKEVASALNSLAKALRQPLETIPADTADLRKRMAEFSPAAVRMTTGRWRNVRSLVQFALTRAELIAVPARSNQELSPSWATLVGLLGSQMDKYKLGRLGRYCSARSIEPSAISEAVLSAFHADLRTRSLVAEPTRLHRDAIKLWNRSLTIHPEWPQVFLSRSEDSRKFTLPWDAFPPSLKADVDAWLAWLAGADPMAECDFRPLRTTSVETRLRQVRSFISALVLRGTEPATLRTLADAVDPSRVGAGLTYFWEKAGKQPSVHGAQIAGVVRSIAKHWVGLGEAEQMRLKVMARKITPRSIGMTARNRAALRPLNDPERQRDLLNLPIRIRADVLRGGKPTISLARELQTAVAIEILIMFPMRIRNLAELKIGTNLLRSQGNRFTITFDAAEVKNEMPLEADLPAPTTDLLDLYLTHYRPLLPGADSPWLFPGKTALVPKGREGLRQQVKKSIRTRCGLNLRPHQFRHAAAKIVLDDNPAAHGQVQRILGHKSINMTTSYYSGLETQAAIERYDDHVLSLRNAGASGLVRARTGRK